MPFAEVRGMPTRIPAGPTSAEKDAAHRDVTIRSDSGWWSNHGTRPDAPLIRFPNPEPLTKVIRILYQDLESRPDVIPTRFRNPERHLGGPQIQLTDVAHGKRSPVIEFRAWKNGSGKMDFLRIGCRFLPETAFLRM